VSTFDAVAARVYRHLIGLALAGAVAAALYVGGVIAGFRASAVTNGSIEEPFLHDRVVIRRDARDVPHIAAGSQSDLYFAQGFVEGSDRLFQMELTRRYAEGTLAEVLGPRALSIDQEQRYFDVRDIAERQWRYLGKDERAALTAFSGGVNAAMARQPLPVEFRLLLYRPRAWTPQDSLAVSMAVSIALADSWHDVLARNDTWRHYGARAFGQYFPLSDAHYDVTLDGSPAGAPTHADAAAVAQRWLPLKDVAVAHRGAPPKAGSNAWAAGGARTASGRALLANDPHLDLTIPGLWYLEDLRAPGMHVAGASIPGAPGILLGHNERIAWGATNGDASAMSLFYAPARVDPKAWRSEVFHVRFSKDVTRSYYRSAREFGVPDPYDGGRLVLVRWPAFSGRTSAIGAFLVLDRARSTREAIDVLAGYRGAAENFVVADTAGNAAYHLAGAVNRDPAWSRYVHGARDLRRAYGDVAFAQLPARRPSRDAIIVTANNKMYREGYPYRLAAAFEAPYRAYRIAQLLRARTQYDPAYFAHMQLDTVSPVDVEFARRLRAYVGCYRDDDPSYGAVARELASWNGSFSQDSRAATVEHALRSRLEVEAPSLYALLQNLRRTRSNASDLDGDLRSVLYDADRFAVPWGRAGAVRIEHPLAPLRFGFLNGATLPGEGNEYTIHLQEPGFSQSFRAVWDVGNWDAGGVAIPSGESGEPGSGHYDDLSAAWIEGRLDPLPFSEAAVEAATRARLVLQP
jgi:penicillin G amidase